MSMTNCINCGSAKETTATVCPFCGTSYFDMTDVDLSADRKPCVVRFKFQNSIFQMKAFITLAELTIQPDYLDVTSLHDYTHRFISQRQNVRANIEFVCVD